MSSGASLREALSDLRSPGGVSRFAGTIVVRTPAPGCGVEIYDMFFFTPGTGMPSWCRRKDVCVYCCILSYHSYLCT